MIDSRTVDIYAVASIARVRTRLLTRLDTLEAAGRALRWLRSAAPRVPEPEVWAEMERVLDALDSGASGPSDVILAGALLRVLSAFGWGFSLEECVVCGAICGDRKAALIDPARGGVVCRACGGGPHLARADVLARGRATQAGSLDALDAASASLWLAWGEKALAAHGTGV